MTHALLERPGDIAGQAIQAYENVTGVQTHGFLPAAIEDLEWGANMLMRSGIVPHLLDQPGRCLAVAYAAARFDMDLVAFAGQTYFTPVKGGGERMAYMSQLVTAIVYARAPLIGRFDVTYFGKGGQRYCVVKGLLRGEKKRKVKTSPIFSQITPKHSPTWFTDPDQQLAYYTQRAWARLWTPDVLLGVYDRDEFPDDASERETRLADPFRDEEEAEAAHEPSGGEDFQAAAKELRKGNGDQGQGQHPNAPEGGKRQQKPSAEKGEHAEPPDLADIRRWAEDRKAEVLDLPPPLAEGRWAEIVAEKSWGRLKAYDLAFAKQIGGEVSRHLKSKPEVGQ